MELEFHITSLDLADRPPLGIPIVDIDAFSYFTRLDGNIQQVVICVCMPASGALWIIGHHIVNSGGSSVIE